MFDRRAPKNYEVGVDLRSSQMFIVEAVRIGFLCAILLVTIVSQSLQSRFINLGTLLPIYGALIFSFLINFSYVLKWEKWSRILWLPGFLFALELLSITYLIFHSGVGQSIFLFMYLVNIILCGFIYQKKGAFILAGASSLFFSFVLVIAPQITEQTLFYVWTLNNTAFFSVAWLSGYLSEQLTSMGGELTEKRRDLSALKNINRLVVENMPSGLIAITQKGRVLQANRAAHKILEVKNLNGENLFKFLKKIEEALSPLLTVSSSFNDSEVSSSSVKVSDFSASSKEESLKNSLKIYSQTPTDLFSHKKEKGKKDEIIRFDFEYVNGRGEKLILSFSASYFENPERSMSGLILIFADQTKIKRLEEEVRQSEKLAAVGQLAAGIAHEIRNPLASMSGSIQMLRSESKSEEEKHLMKIVLKETDRLNNLITDFLDYARPDQPLEDSVDMIHLIKEVMEFIQLNNKERSDVKIKMSLDGEGKIRGNCDKLKQAILNIIINALHAMRDTKKPELSVSTFERDNIFRLTIGDNGCGMSDKMKKRMFEPFQTNKHDGTGLGLAITHRILENHQASVFVDSIEGKGTEMVLGFPLQDYNVISLNQRKN